MVFDAVIAEMYCPKCKQSFEEGSRRFCPTDGARLISEAVSQSGNKREGGIFANLIPKIDAISDLDETLSDTPRFVVTEPNQSFPNIEAEKEDKDEIFFELDDFKPEFAAENEFLRPAEPALAAPKPIARKVNPYEIPAGHVDLGDPDRLTAFSADFNADDPEGFVGRIVKGRYKVTEFLGGDENGLAYLADDAIVEDKKVLVRILLETEPDEIMDSILAEERVSLSHFSHPNIARLIDSGQFTSGTNFLITEYVDALSVNDILSIHGQFSELRAARIVRQAASALNEAHQEGILHRDVRPKNLIIDAPDGEAEQTKLVNFGASNGDPTPQNVLYKAPEILEDRVATTASDIFSLAVVAFEMLTGQMPFSGLTEKEIVRSQHAGVKVHLSDVLPELPLAVTDVLDKALAYDSSDRFTKARDFGDAFYAALAESPQRVRAAGETHVSETETSIPAAPVPELLADTGVEKDEIAAKPPIASPNEPAWKNRSPEPPQEEKSRTGTIAAVGLLMVALVAAGWYYVVNQPIEPGIPVPTDRNAAQNNAEPSPVKTEMPPLPRNVPQPPNTSFYQNTKQNLRGDLLRNFVGFSMFYPKDWRVNGPQESAAPNARGKFLDISRSTLDDRLKEQMLISYYPSKGTFGEDADKFPQMVKETNETLKKLLPGYQMVSEGEIKLNGEWRAYEIKFQGGGTSASGEKLVVWGRRLFIPASRPGVRNGFEITMLATSLADDVRSVDDVGVRGELAAILYSFEPSQNF